MVFQLKADVVNLFLNTFPDCVQSLAESYFDHAIEEIATFGDFYSGALALAISASTRLYTTGSSASSPWYGINSATPVSSDKMLQIQQVHLVTSSTQRTELYPITTRDLPEVNPNWAHETAQYPSHYYVTQSSAGGYQLGVYPTPLVSTTPGTGVGFPRIEISYRSRPAAYTEVPETLGSHEPVLYHMLWKYAEQVGEQDRAQIYQAQFATSIGNAVPRRVNRIRDQQAKVRTYRRFGRYGRHR